MGLETLGDHGTIKYPLPYKPYHLVHLLDSLKCIAQWLLYWSTHGHCSNPPAAPYFHNFFLHLLGGILLPINCSLQHCTEEMYMCHSSHCQHPQKRSAAIRAAAVKRRRGKIWATSHIVLVLDRARKRTCIIHMSYFELFITLYSPVAQQAVSPLCLSHLKHWTLEEMDISAPECVTDE